MNTHMHTYIYEYIHACVQGRILKDMNSAVSSAHMHTYIYEYIHV